jgi:hypothetical protein
MVLKMKDKMGLPCRVAILHRVHQRFETTFMMFVITSLPVVNYCNWTAKKLVT